MISNLRKLNYGCHIGKLHMGCIMYADDLLLFYDKIIKDLSSGSVLDLQRMLDCCGEMCLNIGLNFNCKKSHCMVIGPFKVATPLSMSINR